MTPNKQFANVGNLGDILKHAALTSLVELLHTQGERLLSVDTHAFLLEAPCPDPSRWLVEAQRECSHHPAFGSYIEHQGRVGGTPSRYRCSSGLVLDVSRAVGHRTPALILAECDRDTRARLREQLTIEQVEPHAVLDDAQELQAVAVPDADVMYALVDPFGSLDSAPWNSISEGLSRLARSVKAAVVEVFTYDRARGQIDWPGAPSGFAGPIATIDRGPYHLATYATDGIAEDSARACAALGWKVELADGDITAEDSSARIVTIRARGFKALQDLDDQRLLEVINEAAARLEDDVRASLVHQRRFVERIVHLAAQHCRLDLTFAGDAAAAIRALESAQRLNHHVVRSMHWVRQRGNEAAHSFDTTFGPDVAREGLRHCHDLARWFVARLGRGDLEQFALEVVPVNAPTQRQLRREETQRRRIEALDRVARQQKAENQELRKLLEQRSGGTPPTTVQDTVPDVERLRWVYFATPTKANRSDTYELAYSRGVVCCDAKTSAGTLKPNVKNLRPGDLILLAYGKDGEYEPQLYLTVEPPTKSPIADTDVLHELPNELAPILEGAGYSPDPSVGVFTGFRVTPCSDWKGQLPVKFRKPVGQNFLRTWEEVRAKNGWLKR